MVPREQAQRLNIEVNLLSTIQKRNEKSKQKQIFPKLFREVLRPADHNVARWFHSKDQKNRMSTKASTVGPAKAEAPAWEKLFRYVDEKDLPNLKLYAYHGVDR